jgi:undecaprenyl-diphosphatase
MPQQGGNPRQSRMSKPDDAVGTGSRGVSEAGSKRKAGPTTEGGPLAKVEAASPATPATAPHPPLGTATITVIVGFVALVASLFVLGSIAEDVRAHEVFALDTWATPYLHSIASPGLTAVMGAFTEMGSSLVIVPIFVVAVAWLLRKGRYGAVLFLGVASGGALLIDVTMKLFFQRARPQVDWAKVLTDYSFPSGHTMNGFVFYVALALLAWSVFGRRTGLVALTVAVLLAFWIGVSRIYLGYHFFTDVVGGFLAGFAWLLVVGAAFRARPKWWKWGPEDTGQTRAPRANRSDGPGTAPVA